MGVRKPWTMTDHAGIAVLILVSCVLTVLACTGCGTDCKCEPGSGAPQYTPAPPPPDAGDAGDAMSD
jgi:hypothetical protein